jgi:O-antigen ligase
MNRLILNDWCERGILLLVFSILIFGPLAMGAVGGWEFLVIQGLAIGVLALWAAKIWTSRKPQLLWPPLGWVVLAFTLYAVARYFTADIEYVARLELIQVLLAAFLFFAIVNNLYRQETAQLFSFTMIFLAMAISSCAIWQFLTHSNRVWNLESPYAGRGTGTYISPNNLAGFLEMLIPLAVAYILVGRIKPLTRILLGYAVLMMLGGLTVTFSRGGWVACTVGLLALLGVLIFHRNHQLPALLLLLVLIGGGTVFVTKYLANTLSYIHRVEDPLTEGSVDLDMRRDMWHSAERMWLDNFWWGVGPAHYDYRFRQYRTEHVQLRPDRAHNDYLNLLADWGVAGGIIVLAGMTVFGLGLVKTWEHVRRAEKDFGSGKSNRFAFFLGASAGLLALAVHSAIDFNLHIPANAILGVALLALLTSNLRFATEGYWVKLRPPGKMIATAILALGIVILGWQEWRRGHESFWLARAEQLPNFSPERAAAWQKAFAAEPDNFATAYNIGECYRTQSFDGGDNYTDLANTAMDWYARGMKLNPHDGYNYLRTGMCLDWLDRHTEAEPYFNRADALDPNGYFTADHIGWHYIQSGDYPAARSWFQRSIRLEWNDNLIARNYLNLIEQKLIQQTAGTNSLPAKF